MSGYGFTKPAELPFSSFALLLLHVKLSLFPIGDQSYCGIEITVRCSQANSWSETFILSKEHIGKVLPKLRPWKGAESAAAKVSPHLKNWKIYAYNPKVPFWMHLTGEAGYLSVLLVVNWCCKTSCLSCRIHGLHLTTEEVSVQEFTKPYLSQFKFIEILLKECTYLLCISC